MNPQFGNYSNENIRVLEEYCGICLFFLDENKIAKKNS